MPSRSHITNVGVPMEMVSVIIPTYNDAAYLPDGIASLRRSAADTPLEILIVDDGSDCPASIDELARVSRENPDVRVITKQNEGLAAARNTGLAAASGKFIQFLDADDLLISGKIDQQALLLRKEGLDVVVGAYVIGNESLTEWWYPEVPMFPREFTPAEFVRAWEISLSIPIHAALFRHEALRGMLFDTSLVGKEDWVFWTQLASRSPRVAFYPESPCVVYRHRETSMSRDRRLMATAWITAFRHLQWVWNEMEEAEIKRILQSFWVRYHLGAQIEVPSSFRLLVAQ